MEFDRGTSGRREIHPVAPIFDTEPAVLSEVHKAVIVDFLVGASLADHLGDIRDEEDRLWELLGVSPQERRALRSDDGDAFSWARNVINAKGLRDFIPNYLEGSWDDDD